MKRLMAIATACIAIVTTAYAEEWKTAPATNYGPLRIDLTVTNYIAYAVRFETNTITTLTETSDAVVGCSLWPMICAVYGCDHKQPRPATWREVRKVVTEVVTVHIWRRGEERQFVWSEKTLSDTSTRYRAEPPTWQIEGTRTNAPLSGIVTNVSNAVFTIPSSQLILTPNVNN